MFLVGRRASGPKWWDYDAFNAWITYHDDIDLTVENIIYRFCALFAPNSQIKFLTSTVTSRYHNLS